MAYQHGCWEGLDQEVSGNQQVLLQHTFLFDNQEGI